ncbi:AVID protein, partial [Psilopogon haemacephalus]|nr:AVID protein [Psilopogon haemacephalus]
MVQVTPFLLLLSLALVASGLSSRKCVLTGEWINDLGSNMTVKTVNEDGSFNGIYHTAVSRHPVVIKDSPLKGYQHNRSPTNQTVFGFTVNWNFSDAVAVFTGQCFMDENGKELLKTVWLLRSPVGKIQDDWKATMVGVNNFTRLCSEEE